jgi:Flp pilus assembly protein TadD
MTDIREIAGLEALAEGRLTIAELEGLTAAEAYSVADFGWMLLGQGFAPAAALVFETLTLSNPHHAYFHALHGAALHRSGADADALAAYARALEIDPDETGALVGRAELLMSQDGGLEEAVGLLERAVALDPDGSRPETLRARALVAAAVERLRPAG